MATLHTKVTEVEPGESFVETCITPNPALLASINATLLEELQLRMPISAVVAIRLDMTATVLIKLNKAISIPSDDPDNPFPPGVNADASPITPPSEPPPDSA